MAGHTGEGRRFREELLDELLAGRDPMEREPDARIWFVGDGAVDAEGAKAVGIRFAWASYGYDAAPPPGTDTVLERFGDVLRL